jgi:hypothetical protein
MREDLTAGSGGLIRDGHVLQVMIIAWLQYQYHNSVLKRDTSAIQAGHFREQLGEY